MMKAVVVGASSGLGRCIAAHLGGAGFRVGLLARRKEELDAVAKEAGNDAFPVVCDVTDPASVSAAVEEAATTLGGIDSLVYATGVGPLQRIEDLDAETWRWVFDTNVVGASLVTAAALPHLAAADGSAVYLSTVQSGMTPPWPGTAAYAVSKAALDKLVEAWRAEHPRIGFTRVIIGECPGGEGDAQSQFATGWDRDLAAEVMPGWFERKYMSGGFIDVAELTALVESVLRCGASASIPSVAIIPRPPAEA